MAKYIYVFPLLLSCLVSSQSTDPCRALSEAYQSRTSNKQPAAFRPSEVLACLRTVPVNETLSAAQIEWYQNFIQFQSTLAYLRDPPSGYQLPSVDILGGLQAIQSDIESGSYNSTFYIESDLTDLVLAAYDGHFTVATQLSSTNFPSLRNVQLVSISSNGTDLPKVYFIDDLAEPSASDVVSIDGVDVTEAIESSAFHLQNLDALYNSIVFSLPGDFIGVGFYNSSWKIIQTDNTTYEFRNGTKRTVNNSILVELPFNNITSGQDVYDKFLVQEISTGNTSSAAASQTTAAASSTMASSTSSASPVNSLAAASIAFPRLGYPVPLYVNSDFILAGFFLPNSTDTCVLSSVAFQDLTNESLGTPVGANATAYALNFQSVAKEFLAACRADGRTKLLIDVRSNPGGDIWFAYELFKQLFPSRVPYSGIQARAHPAFDVLGSVISTLGPFTVGDDGALVLAQATVLSYNSSLSSPSETPWKSWSDLYGPENIHDDNFTKLMSWKLSDVEIDLTNGGLVLTGYGNNTQTTPQPFADENITLITDAQCGSTCAAFANLLLTQTNISTIAFGGRPSQDPMAVVGGVEGAEIFSFSIINELAILATELLTNENTSTQASQNLNISKMEALQIIRPLTLHPPLKIPGIGAQSLNFLNAVPQNDPTLTPWQFLPPVLADCRAFYLAGDILNVTYTWERVAKGDFVCVDGGALGRKHNTTSPPIQPFTSGAAGAHVNALFSITASLAIGLLVLLAY